MSSISQPINYTNPDVYQRKAIATRKRRAEADKKLSAEFAERRRQFNEKLDAVADAGRKTAAVSTGLAASKNKVQAGGNS